MTPRCFQEDVGDGNILKSLSAKGNKHTERFTATTCAFTLSPHNIDALFMVVTGCLEYSIQRGWGGRRRAPCSRAEGSLPSLIAVQFARCLYDGVREVEPAAEFTALFLPPYAQPSFDPSGQRRPPLETRPAPLCR